jgi:hypothetical protein
VSDPLRLTALMAFYDEPPHTLERSIRSAAQIIDHLVVVDGAYASFPGGTGRSPEEQREVIQRTADDCELDLLLWQPADVWAGGEPEKRDRMFRLADITGADWYVILDADFVFQYPYRSGPGAVREDLDVAAKRGYEVAKVKLVDYLAADAIGAERKRIEHELLLFYRAAGLAPLHIGPTHYHTTREGSDLHLWGCALTPQIEHFDMTDTVHVQHEWWHRAEYRQAQRWGYYVQRDMHGLEISPYALRHPGAELQAALHD